jgi:transposase
VKDVIKMGKEEKQKKGVIWAIRGVLFYVRRSAYCFCLQAHVAGFDFLFLLGWANV